MGKSSKQKTTNEPSAFAKGYLTPAANAVQQSYQQSQPRLNQISSDIYAQLPGLFGSAFGSNEALDKATGYASDVVGGKYLGEGNPYLSGMIQEQGDSITDRVQATFSKAGRTGSGANTYTLGKALGESESALRYADYSKERDAMAQAASLIPSLNQAQYAGIPAALAAAEMAGTLPTMGARNYASTIAGLVGNYNTQTSTQSQSLGSSLGGLLGAGLSGWASGGFK